MELDEKLYALFLLEKQVRGLSTRKNAAARRLAAQTTRLEQFQQQAKELNDQLKHHQAKAADIEGQANDIEQRIVKHREQMNSVKSNKEYSALLIEVNTLKVEKGKIETQALEELTQVDKIKEQLAEVDAKIADQQTLVNASQKELDEAKTEVGEQLDERVRERDLAVADIAPEVISVFNRLADNYDGEAMAPVIEENRRTREYTCGGCFIQIPVERVNGVIIRKSELTQCPSCGRILYVDQELRTALAGTK